MQLCMVYFLSKTEGELNWIRVSPTPYNVFTAYTLTSTFISDNECVTSIYDKYILETAFTQVLSSATGVVYVNADQEQKFIDNLGLSSCTPGPLNLANTALIQVSKFTTTVDSIGTTLQLLAVSRTLAPVSLPNFSVSTISKQFPVIWMRPLRSNRWPANFKCSYLHHVSHPISSYDCIVHHLGLLLQFENELTIYSRRLAPPNLQLSRRALWPWL